MREFRIQRRIGVIVSAAALGVIILNIFTRFFIEKHIIWTILTHPNVWLSLVIGMISSASIWLDHKLFRIVQVLLFLSYGIFNIIWNSSQDLTGQVFIIIGVLLASQYSLLKDKLLTKIALLLLVVLSSGIISLLLKKDFYLYKIVGHFAGSISLLLVFGAIFSEEIKELLSENRKLQKSMETHKSFVQVGQNVTGLVHNFKGVTQGLENYSYLMEKASSQLGEEQLVGYSRKIREGVKTLSRRIDNILLATRALNDTELREVEINRLLESIVELFNTIRDFKHNVTVRFEFPGEVRLRCNVNECSQIFENIIRNAWEAILERRKGDNRHYGELYVSSSQLEGSVTVLFRDNGIGMEACQRCLNAGQGCLDCERWRVGNTTKEGGTGFGMVYVVDKVRKYGGNLKVRSEPLNGTEVEVSLRSL